MSHYDADVWKETLTKFETIAKHAIPSFPKYSEATIQLLNYSENATYLLQNPRNGDKSVLRVSRPGYHTKQELESELVWLHSIEQYSPITVALPIAGSNGEFVQTVDNEKEEYYCTLFTFLEGEAPSEEHEEDLIFQFEKLGEVTAHLHENSMKHHTHLYELERPTWNYETILGSRPKWGRWEDGLGITPERLKLFQEVSNKIEQRLNDFGSASSKFGLIHADMRLANLLIEKDQIKVIDFDDCGFGWYLYDLATSLSFIEHKSYVPALISSWLKGYRKVRTLSAEEEAEIPTFIMMRRLQLISWIGSRDNETTRELGSTYTEQTDQLAKEYLEY